MLFNKTVEINVSTIYLAKGDGSAVSVISMNDAKDPAMLSIMPTAALKTGVYKVTWSAVVDSEHRTQGTVSFAVHMSSESADAVGPTALWTVFSETRFGVACGVLDAYPLQGVMMEERILVAAITVGFVCTGHRATELAKSVGIQLVADFLHLLAPSVWVAALLLSAVGVLRDIGAAWRLKRRQTFFFPRYRTRKCHETC